MDFIENNFEMIEGIRINKEPIDSLEEYLSYVDHIKTFCQSDELWYRGEKDKNFNLEPSIFRSDNYTPQLFSKIFTEFKRLGRNYLNHENLSIWEWNQIMQHHGGPTYLLDWTEGSLIALYFSLRERDFKKSPCVYVLDPYWLNSANGYVEAVFLPHEVKKPHAAINFYLLEKSRPEFPAAILPENVDLKIQMQKSCFTIHGTNKDGFSRLCKRQQKIKRRLFKLIFKNGNNCYHILRDIQSSGITESTLFPSLEGLSRELKIKNGYSI